MQRYEYRAIPAPRKGEKSKEARSTPERFAHALTQVMNRMGADGWEYLRADTLPCEERVGLTRRQTTVQHMLIFRRPVAPAAVLPAAPAAEEWPLARVRGAPASAPAPEAGTVHDAPAGLPAADPLDEAARRAGMIPPVARPAFGAAPKVGAARAASDRRPGFLAGLRSLKPEGSGG
jgi:hypothetical protein